jgi:hypothetical protein
MSADTSVIAVRIGLGMVMAPCSRTRANLAIKHLELRRK